MVSNRISLGVAFLSKAISPKVSAKAIIHAELVTATGKYLLTRTTYQYNSDLMLDAKTKEIECENILDVLQRLTKAVEHRVQLGYAFDSSALESLVEEDEIWGSFELGAEASFDPELDSITEPVTLATVLQVPARQTKKHLTLVSSSRRKASVSAKLRIKRRVDSRMPVSGVRAR